MGWFGMIFAWIIGIRYGYGYGPGRDIEANDLMPDSPHDSWRCWPSFWRQLELDSG